MTVGLISFSKDLGAIRFPRATIKAFLTKASEMLSAKGSDPVYCFLQVTRGTETWKMPTIDEFLSEVGIGYQTLRANVEWGKRGSVTLTYHGNFKIEVEAPSRAQIEEYSDFVESLLDTGERRPITKNPVRIFIGHGRSSAWLDLKNHLTDIHHINVEAYEVASRSGFTIREVLDSMLMKTSMAFLVMTGEDLQEDGSLRARQNVVHEAGLFQGRLGFQRAIIVRETGVDMLSNLDGIQYIEFAKGNIREAFGEVLGAISREFPQR